MKLTDRSDDHVRHENRGNLEKIINMQFDDETRSRISQAKWNGGRFMVRGSTDLFYCYRGLLTAAFLRRNPNPRDACRSTGYENETEACLFH